MTGVGTVPGILSMETLAPHKPDLLGLQPGGLDATSTTLMWEGGVQTTALHEPRVDLLL